MVMSMEMLNSSTSTPDSTRSTAACRREGDESQRKMRSLEGCKRRTDCPPPRAAPASGPCCTCARIASSSKPHEAASGGPAQPNLPNCARQLVCTCLHARLHANVSAHVCRCPQQTQQAQCEGDACRRPRLEDLVEQLCTGSQRCPIFILVLLTLCFCGLGLLGLHAPEECTPPVSVVHSPPQASCQKQAEVRPIQLVDTQAD